MLGEEDVPRRLAAAVGVLFLSVVVAVNKFVPQPYMDEVFHVPQTQEYCRGNLSAWNPKITTFPGLYLVGAPYAHVIAIVTKMYGAGVHLHWACSAGALRVLNVLMALALLPVLYHLELELHPGQRPCQAARKAVLMGLYPLHFFYTFLYYTDVGSVTFLLLAYLLVLKGRPWISALAAGAAVLFRQTNAPWAGFVLAMGILRHLGPDYVGTTASGGRARKESPLSGWEHPAGELRRLCELAWLRKERLAEDLLPLGLVIVGALGFMVWNGGVVVGDRSAHSPCFHPTQVLYFLLVSLAALGARYLRPSKLLQVAIGMGALARGRWRQTALLAAAACTIACVARYTLVHPYMLADNRHYVFYLWKNILGKYPAAKFLLVPLYLFAGGSLIPDLARARSPLVAAVFVACTAVTLVPAWLVEFRYFTLPFFVLAMHLPPLSTTEIGWTALAFALVNVATLFMFLFRPFDWPGGEVARFIW
mmetsp:Transcript_62273/g.197164  ORF Transcript_62273/g.197164 Transcript_62273/m.197164 type:complete len:478 (+) Transcript_62273:1843-3276(+)